MIWNSWDFTIKKYTPEGNFKLSGFLFSWC